MGTGKIQVTDTADTSKRNMVEQNIIRQVMQMEIPIKLSDLLLTMPQLRMAILNMTLFPKAMEETRDGSGMTATDPMLLTLMTGRHPVVVEMGILGTVLKDSCGRRVRR